MEVEECTEKLSELHLDDDQPKKHAAISSGVEKAAAGLAPDQVLLEQHINAYPVAYAGVWRERTSGRSCRSWPASSTGVYTTRTKESSEFGNWSASKKISPTRLSI
jgi:hypothetical protein